MTSDVPAPDVISTVSGPEPAVLTDTAGHRVSPWEFILIVAIALVSIVTITLLSRDGWFFGDAWDFMATRDLSTIDGWLKPHDGHLQVPVAFVYQTLYSAVGLDYFPLYPLVRAASYASMITWMWWVMRQRGANPVIAAAAFTLLLFLGTSGFLTAAGVGNFIVISVALIVPELLLSLPSGRNGRPNILRTGMLTVALLILVSSTSLGLAVAGATFIVCMLTGRLRLTWLAFLIAFGAYGLWFWEYRSVDGALPSELALGEVPGIAFTIIGNAIARLIGLSGIPVIASVLAVALIGLFVWSGIRRRFDLFDSIFLLTVPLYLLMVALTRFDGTLTGTEAPRFAYNVVLLLAPVLIPKLRPKRTWVVIPVLVGFIVTAAVNVDQLVDGIGHWNDWATRARPEIESAAALIHDGEPVVSGARPRVSEAVLRSLLDDGWDPRISGDSDLIERVRASLRWRRTPTGRVGGVAPLAPGATSSCLILRPNAPRDLIVAGAATLALSPAGTTRVAVTWRDEFGLASRRFELVEHEWMTFVEPLTTADMTIEALGPGSVRVCGVDPAPAET